MNAMGLGGMAGLPGLGAFGAAGAGGAEGQARSMQAMMDSPFVQRLLNNPEFMRNMVRSHPALRRMAESNPEVAAFLNNPENLREMMRVAANPVSKRTVRQLFSYASHIKQRNLR